MARSLLVTDAKQASIALDVATLGTVPPAKASMVDVTGLRGGGGRGDAPRLARLLIKGGQAGSQTLTGGLIWGWDRAEDKPVELGLLRDGLAVTITNARFFGQVLSDVVGAFTHVGVTGTLSASTVVLEVAPIETSEG